MTLNEIAARHNAELLKDLPAYYAARRQWWIDLLKNKTPFPMYNDLRDGPTGNVGCCSAPPGKNYGPIPCSLTIKFKKLITTASPPTRSHENDAGWDLTFLHFTEQDNCVVNFHTGIAVEIPDGFFGLLRPRSSVRNTGYVMASSGVIDSGFRGEIVIPLRKVGVGRDYDPLERVCQLIILPLPSVEFVEVAELGSSSRGALGFGSTGL